jgi:hypothetical protein
VLQRLFVPQRFQEITSLSFHFPFSLLLHADSHLHDQTFAERENWDKVWQIVRQARRLKRVNVALAHGIYRKFPTTIRGGLRTPPTFPSKEIETLIFDPMWSVTHLDEFEVSIAWKPDEKRAFSKAPFRLRTEIKIPPLRKYA